jgi:hypothetical protein
MKSSLPWQSSVRLAALVAAAFLEAYGNPAVQNRFAHGAQQCAKIPPQPRFILGHGAARRPFARLIAFWRKRGGRRPGSHRAKAKGASARPLAREWSERAVPRRPFLFALLLKAQKAFGQREALLRAAGIVAHQKGQAAPSDFVKGLLVPESERFLPFSIKNGALLRLLSKAVRPWPSGLPQ